MRRLWVAVALAPLTLAASLAHADTTVSTATTTPLATSSAGNVTISSTGSITLTTSTAAVTIDSPGATVTNNGSISFTGVSNATGIQANGGAGASGFITGSGGIILTETTTGDTTYDSLLTGPFANGTNRYGIHITSGGFTGLTTDPANTGRTTAIDYSGTITITGENSVGVLTEGTVNGDILLNTGGITVTGGSAPTAGGSPATANFPGITTDVSYGVLATGVVNGNVSLESNIAVTGQNVVGVALNQGATGSVLIGDAITATGYRSITSLGLIADPLLNADQTLQSGPGVYIGGSVAGGVTLSAEVAATTTTAEIPGGTVIMSGSAPAILIGGANPLTIGQAGTTGYDLVLAGGVTASGVYNDVSATGIQIGGINHLPVAIGGTNIGGANVGGVEGTGASGSTGGAFAPVSLPDGILISGTVSASALSETGGAGNATAIDIGAGASIGTINVSGGSVTASSQVDTTSSIATGITAIKIEAGGSVGSLTNSGAIAVSVNPAVVLQNNISVYAGGTTGSPIAVLDEAGSLSSITNTNTISALYLDSSSDITGRGIALYLNNSNPVTVTQNTYVAPAGVTVTGTVTPQITGDIVFGSGDSTLNVNAGTVTGNVSYGAGNNALSIAGDVNGGATVTGALTSTGPLAVTVNNGGILTMENNATLGAAAIPVSSLTVGTGTAAGAGTIIFSADPAQGVNNVDGAFHVAGAATINSGSTIGLNFVSPLSAAVAPGATQAFTVVSATGGLTVATGVNPAAIGQVPYLYNASIDTSQIASGNLTIDVGRKTASELNFSAAEAAAYSSFYGAFSSDPTITADVLSKTSERGLKQVYDQFLPDFAGGPFQTMELGQEAIYRAQADSPLKLQSDQTRGWVQEIGYLDHRDDSDNGGYNGSGFGVVGGLENAKGEDAIGITGAFITTNVKDAAQSASGHLSASVLEAGLYARTGGTGLNFNASINGGWAFFDSRRMLVDANAPDPTTGAVNSLTKVANSNWNGGMLAAHIGVSAPLNAGRFYARPEASIDYYALYESAHDERGGGAAFDLNIASRTSQETLAQADLVLGANLGDAVRWRPEVMVGWRGVMEGGPGNTTASFAGGSNFTLSPGAQDKGGLLARLGVRAGGQFADFSADAGGEYHGSYQTYDARAAARFLF